MPIVALALRSYLRYLVPLTLMSACAFGAFAFLAWRTPIPPDAAAAKSLLQLTWLQAVVAWSTQLALVAAAAPAVRAVAAGTPASQLRMTGRMIANLVRMIIPGACVTAAILVGGMALVVPGVLLAGLLALTAASTEPGLPGPLLDSIAVVRRHWRPVAITLGAIVAFDLALAGVAYLVLASPLPAKPPVALLSDYRDLARVVAVGLVVGSPIGAVMLAAIRARAS